MSGIRTLLAPSVRRRSARFGLFVCLRNDHYIGSHQEYQLPSPSQVIKMSSVDQLVPSVGHPSPCYPGRGYDCPSHRNVGHNPPASVSHQPNFKESTHHNQTMERSGPFPDTKIILWYSPDFSQLWTYPLPSPTIMIEENVAALLSLWADLDWIG